MTGACDELERQVDRLRELGYPALAGLAPDTFDAALDPLLEVAAGVSTPQSEDGGIPLLLVVTSRMVPTTAAVERWCVRGRAGWTDMGDDELGGFHPIDGVEVPEAAAYLLLDVDTGAETLGVTPDDALPRLVGSGRTPLTIDEGVALLTQRPDVLTTHNAYQTLGSRAGDRRVPSIWSSKGAPRLGWCWAGNPHSWLGAASAAARLAP